MNRGVKVGDIVVLEKGRTQSQGWPLSEVVKLEVVKVGLHNVNMNVIITLPTTTKAIFQSGDNYKAIAKRTGDIISVRKSSFKLAPDFNDDSYEIF